MIANELEPHTGSVFMKVCFFCAARHQDVPTRSRYVRLVDNVRDNGGNVRYQNCPFFLGQG